MPVSNIIDNRTNRYKVECNVVIEPCWHDNSVVGATRFPKEERRVKGYVFLDTFLRTTIEEAIMKINEKYPEMPMTMFVYDFSIDPMAPVTHEN